MSTPFVICFDEGIDDCDELSSDGCDDDLVRFSRSPQTIGEGLENRIVMAGDKSGLEHHMPEQPSPTTNGAFPAHGSTVMCNGRKACERCGLLA